MMDKDYIEIELEGNKTKKMEIVLMFTSPDFPNYNYIIYKDFDGKALFAGKMKDVENATLETNLTEEEKKLVEESLKNALVQE